MNGTYQSQPYTLSNGGGFAVVDVETTGLDAERDRIVEIAIVRTRSKGEVIDEWWSFVNPGGELSSRAIHGIDRADLVTAPAFGELADVISDRIGCLPMVAHNANFDSAFLSREYSRAGCQPPDPVVICTLKESHRYLPRLRRRRLVDCCRAVGVENPAPHTALGDAHATAALLAAFLSTSVGTQKSPKPPARWG